MDVRQAAPVWKYCLRADTDFTLQWPLNPVALCWETRLGSLLLETCWHWAMERIWMPRFALTAGLEAGGGQKQFLEKQVLLRRVSGRHGLGKDYWHRVVSAWR